MSGADDFYKLWSDGAKAYQQAGQEMADAWVRAVKPQEKSVDDGLEAWSKFVQAWAPGWDPSSIGLRDTAAAQNAFFQAFDPASWMTQAPDQMRKIMAQFAALPQFADMKIPGVDQAAWGEDLAAYTQAATDFGQVMQDAWLRAYTEFQSNWGEIDWANADMNQLTQSWLKTADAELLRTQAGQAFMDAQKAMIKASTQLKKRQSEAANTWAREVGLPTQDDVDDLAKMVSDLKRELRAVKAELAGRDT